MTETAAQPGSTDGPTRGLSGVPDLDDTFDWEFVRRQLDAYDALSKTMITLARVMIARSNIHAQPVTIIPDEGVLQQVIAQAEHAADGLDAALMEFGYKDVEAARAALYRHQ